MLTKKTEGISRVKDVMNVNSAPGALPRALLLTVCAGAAAACGSESPTAQKALTDSKSPRAKVAQASAETATATAPPEKKPVPKREALPVPEKYFGKMEIPRLEEPITLEPLENGSVLLLVADALNVRHMSLYGYERATSKRLDALGRGGVVFTNHVSNSSWTRPSFTTLITGLSKRQHGMELGGGPLDDDVVTLAERYKKAGYRTASFIGNGLIRGRWNFDQGYDHYQDIEAMGVKAFPRDSILVKKAIKWFEKIAESDEPYFAVFFLTSTHPPYRPPRDDWHFLKQVPSGHIIEHPYKEYKKPLPKDAHDRIVAAYDDEVRYMDEQIGKLLDFMKEKKLLDNAVVAFTSDHGELFGQHNCYLHAYHMWEPALRMPLILDMPNLPVRGVYDDSPTTHIDLAPTLLELSGHPELIDESLRGISVSKFLDKTQRDTKRVRFSQYNAHGVRRQAIRKGRYKLVHHHKVPPSTARKLDQLHPTVDQPDPRNLPTLAWDGDRYEAFDLLADPEEKTSIYEAKKDLPQLRSLREALAPFIEDKPSPDVPALSPETMEALRNAGYIR